MNTQVSESIATVVKEYFRQRGRECTVNRLEWAETVPGIITVTAPFEFVQDCLKASVMVAFNRVGSTYAVNVRFGGYICNQHGWAPCYSATYNESAVPPAGPLADELQHLCREILSIY